MYALDQYSLVVTAVEDDHFTLSRDLLVNSPQKIMILFLGCGSLETRDAHALWINPLKDAPNGTVLTTSVHRLENDQYFVLVLSINHSLKVFKLLVQPF